MAALAVAMSGLAGCGADDAKVQRAQAEQAAREARAAAEAKAELEADQERFKKISTSLADPNAKPADESERTAPIAAAAEPPPAPAPLPVSAAPTEQNLGASERAKKLKSSVAVLEGLAAEGLECSNTLKTYPQPDQQQLTRCLKFTEHTAPDTEWTRALGSVAALSSDDQFFRANEPAFVKAQKLIEDVRGYDEYAWSRLRTITGQTKPV